MSIFEAYGFGGPNALNVLCGVWLWLTDHVWMHLFVLFWSNPRGRVESEGLMCTYILVGHWNPVKRVLWMSKSGRARRSFGTGFATWVHCRTEICTLALGLWLEIWDSEGKDITFNLVLVCGYCSAWACKSTTITMDGYGISMNINCCNNLFVDFIYILSSFLIIPEQNPKLPDSQVMETRGEGCHGQYWWWITCDPGSKGNRHQLNLIDRYW